MAMVAAPTIVAVKLRPPDKSEYAKNVVRLAIAVPAGRALHCLAPYKAISLISVTPEARTACLQLRHVAREASALSVRRNMRILSL